jgi:hypothetical protein
MPQLVMPQLVMPQLVMPQLVMPQPRTLKKPEERNFLPHDRLQGKNVQGDRATFNHLAPERKDPQ